MAKFSLRLPLTAFALGFVAVVSHPAAEPAKRALTHQDYDGWRSIASQTLARDGRYLAYAYMPLEGDGDLIVRELATGREQRVPVGALPPPPLTASEENPERPAPRRELSVAFTSDSGFVVALTFPTKAETLQAKHDRKKNAALPKDGLVILSLASGATDRVAAVKNWQVPAKGGAWVAYLREPMPDKKDGSLDKSVDKDQAAPKKKDRKFGSDLVLRDLTAPKETAERRFPNVLEYSFARDGRTLVFTVASPTESENGVFAVTPGNPAAPVALATGAGQYLKFAWDREQHQAAFVTDRAEPAAQAPRFALWYWKRGDPNATELIGYTTPGLPAGFGVSDDALPGFSFDGRKLYVGTAPLPKVPDARLETQLDDEKVTADLWHWNDDYLPPFQKQRADKERKRSYLGVLDLADRRFVQLSDPSLPTVTFNDDGSRAFGWDDRAYRRRTDYDGTFQDLYLVDAASGSRRLLVRELGEKAGVRWSHNGRWLAYYADKQWFAIDACDGSIRPLTAALPFAFFDEISDVPEMPGAYGTAGWTRDGESLLLYDRYDLWQVFPDGRPARNLTAGFGRANKIQLRVQPIEPTEPGDDKRGLDPAQPLYFRGENEVTRATGFFRTSFGATTPPERLLWAEKNYRYLTRALGADTLLLSASRFDEYPDLLTTDSTFSGPAKVSHGGVQLGPFLWGSSELLTYRNADGVELAALLCKPANFDPAKKYPMIVYLYERLSQTVHTFTPPVPNAYINPSYYTSNGYLVLMPDIVYTTGHPGQSALKCVLPAVDEIVRRGCVDEKAIGLAGHSWGGYQTAYLITQTNRFRAAEAGALVGNMTSAYSGIRWGSGRARQFQYEKSQSRIGQPLAEAPLLYLENSPVFFAPRVQTPLLMLHNDQDDAVPWYQGIEFFLALRRAGKEVYFFNYNNEFHGLRRRADQKDFTKRLSQFFDTNLKGAPPPDWMTHGIPYLEREEEKLRFRDTP